MILRKYYMEYYYPGWHYPGKIAGSKKIPNRLYITYNLKQLVEKLGRSDRTISKAMKQLSEVGLIEKKKEDRGSRTLFM